MPNTVLGVVDLDPQTNATIALISEEEWEKLDEAGHTLYQRFNDKKTPSCDIDHRERVRRMPQFSRHCGRQAYLVEQLVQPFQVAQVPKRPQR